MAAFFLAVRLPTPPLGYNDGLIGKDLKGTL
jgi:hypothetical protein